MDETQAHMTKTSSSLCLHQRQTYHETDDDNDTLVAHGKITIMHDGETTITRPLSVDKSLASIDRVTRETTRSKSIAKTVIIAYNHRRRTFLDFAMIKTLTFSDATSSVAPGQQSS